MRIGIQVRKAGGGGNERDQRAKPTKARSKVHLKSNCNFLHGHSLELAYPCVSAIIASDTCFHVYPYSIRNMRTGVSLLISDDAKCSIYIYIVDEQI